jgi:hypothetical protein
MKKMVLFLALGLSLNVVGYSRFNLPHDDSISVPGGVIVAQYTGEVDPYNYDVEDEEKYLLYGLGIVDFGNGFYQSALLGYHCEEVDDGAYGALYCDSADFIKYTGEICEPAHRAGEFWCE